MANRNMSQCNGDHCHPTAENGDGSIVDEGGLGKHRVKPNISFDQGVDLLKTMYGLRDVVYLQEFTSYHNQNMLVEARLPTRNPRTTRDAEQPSTRSAEVPMMMTRDYAESPEPQSADTPDKKSCNADIQPKARGMQGDDIPKTRNAGMLVTELNAQHTEHPNKQNAEVPNKCEAVQPKTRDADSQRIKLVLKILNSDDSELFTAYKLQNEILLMLGRKGIPCPQPLVNLQSTDLSYQQLSFTDKDTGLGHTGRFLVRVMRYIPGQYVRSAPLFTAKMCFEIGQLVGKTSNALQEFHCDMAHFVEKEERYIWSIRKAPLVRKHVTMLTDQSKRDMVEEILDAFEDKVLANEHKFQKGLIQGDFNEFNILVREKGVISNDCEGDNDVVGIVDFDDMLYTCIIYDLAIAIMYMMQCPNLERDPVECAGVLIAGFFTESALGAEDWAALYYCVAARFAQSLLMGLYTYSLQPGNEYILSTQVKGWDVMRSLWEQDAVSVYDRWIKLIEEYSDNNNDIKNTF